MSDDGARGGGLATRLGAIPWALRTVAREVVSRVRGEPPVREAALRWAREHAKPGDPASVLASLDRFAVERRFLMNVGDEKGPLLDRIVGRIGPGARILELGTFVGYSAVLMSRHLGAAGRLVSIDVDPESARVGRSMAEFAGTADRCEFLHGKSTDVLGRLDRPFDLVFLDHWKGLYLPDARVILDRGLLAPGGTIVADNVGPLFGDNPYVPWMRAREDFESQYVPGHVEYETIEDGVLVSRHRPARA
ncbi:MAG: O-methyltransferase [Alphaproteobacteria bacterium]